MRRPHEKNDGSMPSGAIPTELASPSGLALELTSKGRLADYCELAKLRLSLLVLFVTAAGFCLGATGPISIVSLLYVVFGTGLVAFGANALNQVLERDFDRLMVRTADRPIPSGRIAPGEALAFSLLAATSGCLLLAMAANGQAALLAFVTLLLYVGLYTPLKRLTSLNTLVGAVPGAIPPLIGFVAARGELTVEALLLFAIVFFWQMPHFFAIAWLYREDYRRGGYRMLSVVDPSGRAIGLQTVIFCGLLVAVSFLPAALGIADFTYLAGAAVLGFAMAIISIRFAILRTASTARMLLLASIAYLPPLMMLLLAACSTR